MTFKPKIKICLVDDHKLFRRGMVELISGFENYAILWEASNGLEVQSKIVNEGIPDIMLMDSNMPQMNGEETIRWLQKEHPSIKTLVLSMYDDEKTIIKMIRAGANGYILKDADPAELRIALDEIVNKGYTYSELVNKVLLTSVRVGQISSPVLTAREIEFLNHVCTELTYKEIADKMNLATRTIDGYREALFEKLNCKSRVGLVLFSVKNGVVKLH